MVYNPETTQNQQRHGRQSYNNRNNPRLPNSPARTTNTQNSRVPDVFMGNGVNGTQPPKSSGQMASGNTQRSASSSGGGTAPQGGGMAFSSGGSLGSTATGSLAPASMPSDSEWLSGDTSYQSQLAALKKAMDDFGAQDNLARSQYETDYGVNTANLGRAKTEGLAGQENDFASRGMINSGLFADERSQMEAEFGRRGDEMGRGRQNFLDGRNAGKTNFEAEQNLVRQQALADALSRRASQYGGGLL